MSATALALFQAGGQLMVKCHVGKPQARTLHGRVHVSVLAPPHTHVHPLHLHSPRHALQSAVPWCVHAPPPPRRASAPLLSSQQQRSCWLGASPCPQTLAPLNMREHTSPATTNPTLTGRRCINGLGACLQPTRSLCRSHTPPHYEPTGTR